MTAGVDDSPLLRSAEAPDERTLVEVLEETVRVHGDEPALDDGTAVLSYRELLAAVDVLAQELAGVGIGRGDRVGVRCPRARRPVRRHPRRAALGAAYVPVDADDPEERARLVFGEAGVVATILDGPTVEIDRPASVGWGPEADPGRRRLGHLHVGLDRGTQGRGGLPSLRGRVRRRRGRLFLATAGGRSGPATG